MQLRRVTIAVITILAFLLPAVALAQGPTPFGNTHSLFAVLRGDLEVSPGDPDGFGFARVAVNLDENQICYQLSVAGTDMPIAAHIHVGAAGVNGPVVVPFLTPIDGLARECVAVAADLAAMIVNNPAGYYVNVHTGVFPAGAVRGQLAWLGGPVSVDVPAGGPTVDVIADGLNSPRGIAVTDDGVVYVAQAGLGGDDCVTIGEGEEEREACFGDSSAISMITDDGVEDVISGLPSFLFSEGEFLGAQDVVIATDGSIYGVVGLGMDPALRDEAGDPANGLGTFVVSDGAGGWVSTIDIAAYEAANNPDGGLIDSNPYSAYQVDGGVAVADAGANAVLWVPDDGAIETVASFPDTMVDAPPFLGLPEGAQIPMQAVPTSVVQGPDGAWYVGQLTGFPFVPGAAKVWRVVPGEAPTVYAEGFTNIISLAFDADGNLYVLEITAGGLLNINPEDMSTMAGRLAMVDGSGHVTDLADVSSQLVTPGGMTFGPDGTLYISNFGLMPGMGQILSVSWDD